MKSGAVRKKCTASAISSGVPDAASASRRSSLARGIDVIERNHARRDRVDRDPGRQAFASALVNMINPAFEAQ